MNISMMQYCIKLCFSSPIAALFVGDVFKYLQNSGKVGDEGPIVKIVSDAFRNADEIRRKTKEPLVILGHSMGGNIAYDILTHFPPDLQCDLFLTVGAS
jgi:dienelactone hydrolase